MAEFNHLDWANKYYREEKDLKKGLQECDSAVSVEISPADAHNTSGIILAGLAGRPKLSRLIKRRLKLIPGKEPRENPDNLESVLKGRSPLIEKRPYSLSRRKNLPGRHQYMGRPLERPVNLAGAAMKVRSLKSLRLQ